MPQSPLSGTGDTRCLARGGLVIRPPNAQPARKGEVVAVIPLADILGAERAPARERAFLTSFPAKTVFVESEEPEGRAMTMRARMMTKP